MCKYVRILIQPPINEPTKLHPLATNSHVGAKRSILHRIMWNIGNLRDKPFVLVERNNHFKEVDGVPQFSVGPHLMNGTIGIVVTLLTPAETELSSNVPFYDSENFWWKSYRSGMERSHWSVSDLAWLGDQTYPSHVCFYLTRRGLPW